MPTPIVTCLLVASVLLSAASTTAAVGLAIVCAIIEFILPLAE